MSGKIQAYLKDVPMLINGIPFTVEQVRVTLSYNGNGNNGFELDEILSIDDYEVDIDGNVISEKIIENKVNWDNVELLYDTMEEYNYFDEDYFYMSEKESRIA